MGIQEKDLPRIFEKGFTGENGRNQKKSTGIGLYLCKKLCDQLGLEIYAQSKAGSYTKIILQFPQNNIFQRYVKVLEKSFEIVRFL